MAKISELTGEAREQRIAELKKKMQESAARVQAAHAAGETLTRSSSAPAAVAEEAAEVEVVDTVEAAPAEEAVAESASESTVSGNGAAISKPVPAAAPAAPRPAPKAPPKPKAEDEMVPTLTPQEMNRREFLTYAWGAALGVLGLEAGVATFQFLYPRFREGEFGGNFRVPLTEVPDATAAPVPYTAGKFWLVSTEEGAPKAIYMVCTHLGCLYKWEPSTVRFECPCHGSKFSHDGYYIEGPAPRSLDYFETSEENGELIVNTGSRITGDPAAESPARIEVA